MVMEEIARSAATGSLVITHNPMTASRMYRPLGGTMQEKGVSQLVYVDLQGAERFREGADLFRSARADRREFSLDLSPPPDRIAIRFIDPEKGAVR
jgi:hypothetical protein